MAEQGSSPVGRKTLQKLNMIGDAQEALRNVLDVEQKLNGQAAITLYGFFQCLPLPTNAFDTDVLKCLRSRCTDVLTDEGYSGADFTRPGLTRLLRKLRRGDTIVVWRLDRLGRSLFELLKLIRDLNERGVEFRSLSESLDTGTPAGRLLLHVLASMAEFERSLISERTRAGMAAARARGSRIGRRPAMTEDQRRDARQALANGSATAEAIAKQHGIHPRTLLRTLRVDAQRLDASH